MSKTKTILIYGLNPVQRLQLSVVTQKAGINCKIISDRQTTLPISVLLTEQQLPEMPAFPLTGKFALLDGFDGQEHMAASMINQVAPGVVKAAHTKHNHGWRFCDLCSAVQLEHRSMTER